MKQFIFYILITISSIIHTDHTVYIVVHGTWARDALWAKTGGDFYQTLQTQLPPSSHLISFSWSGKNSPEARNAAGIDLANTIASYPKKTNIIIISHSHGGNVTMRASQFLAQKIGSPNISIVYALATPICIEYPPNMNTINYVYNLFSFEDMIQPVFGFFKRTYPDHPRIANISIVVQGKEPTHTTIHTPIMGYWLSNLHEYLMHSLDNTDTLFSKPGRISFFADKPPVYEVDALYQKRIERDDLFLKLCVTSLLQCSDMRTIAPLLPYKLYLKYH